MSLKIKTNQDFMQILAFSNQQKVSVRNLSKNTNGESLYKSKKLYIKSLKAAIDPLVSDESWKVSQSIRWCWRTLTF